MDHHHKKPALSKQDDCNNLTSSSSIVEQLAVEEDRISSLPDSVLITILSLIPFESSAATSAVSRRWRHLWTHLTHISLPPRLRRSPAFDKEESFVATVNHILSQLNSPKIHTFQLIAYNFLDFSKKVGSSFLVPWIQQICRRNPERIQVSFNLGHRRLQSYQLPTCIVRAHSLVQLELGHFFEFVESTDDGKFSVNLPNLKKLSLHLRDSQLSLLGTLLESCPLLEDLSLSVLNLEIDICGYILAPNLKLLSICIEERRPNDQRFVIDAPMLEQFHISGVLMYFSFIEKPTSLRKVTLSMKDSRIDNGNDYLSKIMGLFQGISCTEYLRLYRWEVFLLILLGEAALPIFHNLIHLDIVHYDEDEGWDSFPVLPACLLGNLKQLDLHGLVGNDDLEIEMIQDILSKATIMKQLCVHGLVHSYYGGDKLRKEYDFCVKLFMLSGSSLSCDIKFFGDVIIASTEDFKDGELTCKIRRHWN